MVCEARDEDMIEEAVRILLSPPQDPRIIVRFLVTHWPDASALQVIYVIAMAAGAVEHMFSRPESRDAAHNAWRMIGIIGVDLYTMECLGLPKLTARDLLSFWREHDRFFLD